MANRPFLLAHNSEVPIRVSEYEESIAASASNQIPVLWLCLFRVTDLKNIEIVCVDSVGHEEVCSVPTLHTRLETANAVYQDRRTRIRNRLPDDLQGHIDEWEDFIASIKEGFVQVDLAEIWMMFEAGEFEKAIRDYLEGIEGTNDDGWLDIVDQAALDNPDVAKYGLRGYQWINPVPWSN
ncbi:hypothetical protein JXQ70_19915 [bacterium]|nr:hypothetical protein [bacterium]